MVLAGLSAYEVEAIVRRSPEDLTVYTNDVAARGDVYPARASGEKST